MRLLIDIGNTHTHLGLAGARGVRRQAELRTEGWRDRTAPGAIQQWLGRRRQTVEGVAVCSVVPWATTAVVRWLKSAGLPAPLELRAANVAGIRIDYPRPTSIGPDRLANAIAARARFGAPVLVLDFGTAVTLDVVDPRGCYVGGVIAPGLAAMTDYLHEKTALLPRIRIREVRRAIGRSTEEAMLVGAVHGYRGLIRALVGEVRTELGLRRVPVVATGGYARLMARGLSVISAVEPALTLEGLRLFWEARAGTHRGA